MRKPTFCICENKDADQLRHNREADQRLCFRYIESAIHLLSKSEVSRLFPSSVAAQPGLCRTRSETRTLVFPHRGSNYISKSWYMSIVKAKQRQDYISFTSRLIRICENIILCKIDLAKWVFLIIMESQNHLQAIV